MDPVTLFWRHVFYKQQHSNTELRWRSGDTCNGSHLADFGLAKFCDREMSYVTLTGGRGTPGYAAPELWMPIPVTQKCDVYSFGMLLFEILGRRRNLQFQESAESQAFEWFPRWVWQKFEHGEMESIVSACGIEEEDREKAERMCQVALWCVQYQPEARPSMGSVVRMLEGEDEIVPPTNPFQYMASLSVSSASGTVNTNASTSSATGIDDSESTSSYEPPHFDKKARNYSFDGDRDDTFSATCTSTNLRSQTQPEDNRIKRKMTPNATEKAEGHSDLNINPPRKPDNVYINTR
ncbi:Protein kinase domain containing protein [Musa troglodytarum]|uniref:Protein kinase domain containing protein n=1 Tax=Musa troglodytarum TaxID=320322 RepID=A0A9E7I6M1_9LILI|nr:Protein kinase domain containing protein [Musa troglodytarum]